MFLPEDEGAHQAPFEWWYFNGHLTDEAGGRYSYHFVAFEITTPEGLKPRLLQLGWSDHAAGVHLTAEAPGFAPATTPKDGFDIEAKGWRMRGDGRDYSLRFDVGDFALELAARSERPALLHEGSGLVDLGRAGETYYYTRSRLATSGVMEVAGEPRRVTGESWLDRQWGDFGTQERVGWDWLSLQLDDGSDLMVSQVWEAQGHRSIKTYGTYVAEDDAVQSLTAPEIALTATGSWTSPATGTDYPMGWELAVGSIPLRVTLTPALEQAEFAGSGYIPVPYWEGAVTVEGSKDGLPITGRGFVELVGYAQPVAENPDLSVPGQ